MSDLTDALDFLRSLQGLGLRFYHRLIRTLTLPNNAGPNDPAIIIGSPFPAELQTYYSSLAAPGTVIAAMIWRQSATNYIYEADVTFLTAPSGLYKCCGIRDTTGLIQELYRIGNVFGPGTSAVMSFGVPQFTDVVIGGQLEIPGSGSGVEGSGSSISLDDNSTTLNHLGRTTVFNGQFTSFAMTAIKGTENQNNTTTVTDDPDLQIEAPFNGRYLVEMFCAYQSPVAAGFVMGFDGTGPLGSNGRGLRWCSTVRSSADSTKPDYHYTFDQNTITVSATNSFDPFILRGVWTAKALDILKFKWAQSVANAGPTKVLTNSYLSITQISN